MLRLVGEKVGVGVSHIVCRVCRVVGVSYQQLSIVFAFALLHWRTMTPYRPAVTGSCFHQTRIERETWSQSSDVYATPIRRFSLLFADPIMTALCLLPRFSLLFSLCLLPTCFPASSHSFALSPLRAGISFLFTNSRNSSVFTCHCSSHLP